MPDPTCTTLQQQPAPQTSRIVITTKDVDPLCSFVKEVDVGNAVICYVPRNVVFSESPNFFSIANNVVHVKCTQTDVNFSMALLCKPQQVQENCLAVWTVDDRIRRHAMWSSPEYVYLKNEEPQMSVKAPWFLGRGMSRDRLKDRLLRSSVRGPVSFSGPAYEESRSGAKKYQGRVPSIVALLTSHAKSHQKVAQKSIRHPESPVTMQKIFQASHSGMEKEFWQQKRFASVSQEIHKASSKPSEQSQVDALTSMKGQSWEDCTINPIVEKLESLNKGKKFGFSYHLDPPMSTCQVNRPTVLNLPPPPQMPLPPVPEVIDHAIPGPSSRSDNFSGSERSSAPWKDLPPATDNSKSVDACKPFAYKAHRLSESVTFVNPYTKKADHEGSYAEEARATEAILTPHSERQRRESTCLFLPEDVVKSHDINTQKLSAVLVLTAFVMALLIFYLVYFL